MKSGGKQTIKTSSKMGPSSKKAKTISSQRKPMQAVDLSRANLVGKFPHIQHQPAPKARYLLSEEARTQLVARMVLK